MIELENYIDPFTQEELSELAYPVFIVEQDDGKKFGFDPVSLVNYILKEGKALNVYNRQPLTSIQIQDLQTLMDKLYEDKFVKDKVDLLKFLQEEADDIQTQIKHDNDSIFTYETFCLEVAHDIVICCKFYDEDVAATVLYRRVLPAYKMFFQKLAKVDKDAARLMNKRCLNLIMDPFRAKKYRSPSYPYAIAIAFIKKLDHSLRPIFVIQKASQQPSTQS